MSARILGSLLLLIGLVISFNAQTTTQTAAPTDLSGTYTGTFDCDVVGLTGDTTLTITGNQFTTAEGKTGRIVTSSSGGYMAVALQVGESTAGSAPQIVSLRARKSGTRLTLTPIPGSMQKCTFTPARTARGRRNPRTTPAAAGTEVANPAAPAMPAAPTTPVPANTPSTAPARPEAPIPSQTPAPSPSPEPSPEPNPSPGPSPMPSPVPSPTVMPSPAPSPSASPSPTASPTPSPAPARPRG